VKRAPVTAPSFLVEVFGAWEASGIGRRESGESRRSL
jgi:hypothetical protein